MRNAMHRCGLAFAPGFRPEFEQRLHLTALSCENLVIEWPINLKSVRCYAAALFARARKTTPRANAFIEFHLSNTRPAISRQLAVIRGAGMRQLS